MGYGQNSWKFMEVVVSVLEGSNNDYWLCFMHVLGLGLSSDDTMYLTNLCKTWKNLAEVLDSMDVVEVEQETEKG